MEVLKFYLLNRALDSQPDSSPHVFYTEMIDDVLVFRVEGLGEDRIGLPLIPKEIYTQTEKRLDKISMEKPFDEILAPPYVSVNTIYQSR